MWLPRSETHPILCEIPQPVGVKHRGLLPIEPTPVRTPNRCDTIHMAVGGLLNTWEFGNGIRWSGLR